MGDSAKQRDPERDARRHERREAMRALASEVRALVGATVSTNVAPEEVRRVTAEVRVLRERLAAAVHPGLFSGLVGRGSLGRRDPELVNPVDHMPLSPWAGAHNPISPPLEMRYGDGRVDASVVLGRQYTGPPGCAHGGVVAGLMDQMLASAGQHSVKGVTGSMTVKFRKLTPLGVRLDLEAWPDPATASDSRVKVRARIKHGEDVTVEAEALVIRSRQLEARE